MLSKASCRLSSPSTASGPPNAGSSLSSPFGLGVGLGKITIMTQADVGHAALRVGESVFSGMKFLGGIPLEAAKSRVGPGPEGRIGAFVSRPLRSRGEGRGAGSGPRHGLSSQSEPASDDCRFAYEVYRGEWALHLVHLSPLLSGTQGAAPTKIDEFNASRSQPVADLQFSKDGTSVAAVLWDGHPVKCFQRVLGRPMNQPGLTLTVGEAGVDVKRRFMTCIVGGQRRSLKNSTRPEMGTGLLLGLGIGRFMSSL
ncbi:hypothetical protein BDZ97DRAFT_2058466 [Flammula alnicola]|nr:hypothetical protein BDZ97DRAFT_2058466 [Flammula alnicola]